MSDRRPEKLYAGEPDFDAVAQKAVDIGLGHHVSRVDLNILVAVALESMESDPVAVVRREVEDGTIEGEVERRHVGSHWPTHTGNCSKHCSFDEVLVIPVSDAEGNS